MKDLKIKKYRTIMDSVGHSNISPSSINSLKYIYQYLSKILFLPQGSVLGLFIFILYISDLPVVTGCFTIV